MVWYVFYFISISALSVLFISFPHFWFALLLVLLVTAVALYKNTRGADLLEIALHTVPVLFLLLTSFFFTIFIPQGYAYGFAVVTSFLTLYSIYETQTKGTLVHAPSVRRNWVVPLFSLYYFSAGCFSASLILGISGLFFVFPVLCVVFFVAMGAFEHENPLRSILRALSVALLAVELFAIVWFAPWTPLIRGALFTVILLSILFAAELPEEMHQPRVYFKIAGVAATIITVVLFISRWT